MPRIQTFSKAGVDATFVGLSISIPGAISIRGTSRISASANATPKAIPATATPPQKRETGRPSGNTRSSARKSPLGTTSETDQ